MWVWGVVQYVIHHAMHPLNTLCVPIKSTSKLNSVTPNITLLDHVFVNSAAKSSLRVVLDKIAVDAGINTGSRISLTIGQWRRFDNWSWKNLRIIYGLCAITGLGHEEMINVFFKFHFVGILRNSRLFRTKFTFILQNVSLTTNLVFDNLLKFRESV